MDDYPPTQCDIRGCVGAATIGFDSTVHGLPARVEVCDLHDLRRWKADDRHDREAAP